MVRVGWAGRGVLGVMGRLGRVGYDGQAEVCWVFGVKVNYVVKKKEHKGD